MVTNLSSALKLERIKSTLWFHSAQWRSCFRPGHNGCQIHKGRDLSVEFMIQPASVLGQCPDSWGAQASWKDGDGQEEKDGGERVDV